MRSALATVLAALAAVVVVVSTPLAADAQTLFPQSVVSPVGIDISYPQCAAMLATTPAFVVVGVNGGKPNDANGCLSSELTWAANVGLTPSLYVNTANPGKANASWWPATNVTHHDGVTVKNPYGTCANANSSACAYVYGYSMALDDTHATGLSLVSTYTWWLDVETSNSWSASGSDAILTSDQAHNRAALEGMVAVFRGQHAKSVGLYSTHTQFTSIAGSVPASSTLRGLPSWLSGATSQSSALAHCATAPLTAGGRVTLAQYTPRTLDTTATDQDVTCKALATAHPTVSGVAAVHHTLSAKAGAWTTGVKLTYQWRRSGHAIAGATHSTYTPTTHDRGSAISVQVTGTLAGYRLATRTSSSVTVATALSRTPKPTISGTATVGHVVTAHAGTWKPSHVALHYQWLRNGVAIKGATGTRHTVTIADAGTKLSVAVRGTKHGYATVTETSATKSIPAVALKSLTAPTVQASGSTLSATSGGWSGSALTYAYQWLQGGTPISGATSATYVVPAGVTGSFSVTVTARSPHYSTASATSTVVSLSPQVAGQMQGTPLSY